MSDEKPTLAQMRADTIDRLVREHTEKDGTRIVACCNSFSHCFDVVGTVTTGGVRDAIRNMLEKAVDAGMSLQQQTTLDAFKAFVDECAQHHRTEVTNAKAAAIKAREALGAAERAVQVQEAKAKSAAENAFFVAELLESFLSSR